MSHFESIKGLAKERSILFVEDDPKVVENMKSILSNFFQNVYIANDGFDGEKLYKDLEPDMILTDINMPKQDGISMAKNIRKDNQNIPIIVMTAYSDEMHLMESIYIGIDRYIKKPLSQDSFFDALHHCLLLLHQRDEAQEYARAKEREKINKTALKTLKDSMDIFPNPVFVFDDEQKLYYINVYAAGLFKPEDLSYIHANNSIDSFIVEGPDRLCTLLSVSVNKMAQNKLMLRMPSGRQRVYWVHHKYLEVEGTSLHIYTLGDITRAEYELQKSNNLSTYLHEVIRFYRKHRSGSVLLQKEPVSKKEQEISQEQKEQEELSYEKIRLDAMHYDEKTDAKSYVSELDESIKDELDELEELEKEMKELLLDSEESMNEEAIRSIAALFDAYGRVIGLLIDFEDISFSLQKLSELLAQIEYPLSDTNRMILLLKAIAEDLGLWRRTIFVEQETVDIHYLDASLLSSCLQIETDFAQGEAAAGSDELELF